MKYHEDVDLMTSANCDIRDVLYNAIRERNYNIPEVFIPNISEDIIIMILLDNPVLTDDLKTLLYKANQYHIIKDYTYFVESLFYDETCVSRFQYIKYLDISKFLRAIKVQGVEFDSRESLYYVLYPYVMEDHQITIPAIGLLMYCVDSIKSFWFTRSIFRISSDLEKIGDILLTIKDRFPNKNVNVMDLIYPTIYHNYDTYLEGTSVSLSWYLDPSNPVHGTLFCKPKGLHAKLYAAMSYVNLISKVPSMDVDIAFILTLNELRHKSRKNRDDQFTKDVNELYINAINAICISVREYNANNFRALFYMEYYMGLSNISINYFEYGIIHAKIPLNNFEYYLKTMIDFDIPMKNIVTPNIVDIFLSRGGKLSTIIKYIDISMYMRKIVGYCSASDIIEVCEDYKSNKNGTERRTLFMLLEREFYSYIFTKTPMGIKAKNVFFNPKVFKELSQRTKDVLLDMIYDDPVELLCKYPHMIEYYHEQSIYVIKKALAKDIHNIKKFNTTIIPSYVLIEYIKRFGWIPIKVPEGLINAIRVQITYYIQASDLMELMSEGYGWGYIFDCNITHVRNTMISKAAKYISSSKNGI